ncbi:MAG: hypothetical protein CL840_12565 [Crocinitomicaceae bacterium]|nr:hypothetical protein [Crocinitomicaceae bacterium]|tara:strand:- start:6727 stop:10062 length:3336 start_codon:yes stop_codon:yes gene_type:complete
MTMNSGNYNDLLLKLDGFIRKYYTNRLIRGGLYSTALITGFYVIIVLLEAAGRFGSGTRTIMFFSFIVFLLGVVYRYIITPLLKLYQIGDRISPEQAATIVGKHFPAVNDKLLNTIELKKLSDISPNQSSLILASIEQRSEKLRPIPFSSAIDLSENRKYLKYALPPIALILIVLFTAPSLITAPTERLLDYDEHFEQPRPFDFVVLNDDLRAIKNEDFVLEISMEGEEIPQEVFIDVDGVQYRMDKLSGTKYKYTARNIQKSTDFKFYASGFYSAPYTLQVFPRPVVNQSVFEVKYPSYIGKQDEQFTGVNDVYLPEGTQIKWTIKTEHTQEVRIEERDTVFNAKQVSEDKFTIETGVKQSKTIRAFLMNNQIETYDSLQVSVNAIKDLYPEIQTQELGDSLSYSNIYFTGKYRDDYGFTGLWFVYQKNNGEENRVAISINNTQAMGEFYHLWNLKEIGVEPDDNLRYYFEIWDNDGVNGPKKARSQMRTLNIPSTRDIQEKAEKQSEETKKDMEESLNEAKDLRKELEKLNKKLLEKKTVSWEEKKRLKELMNQQKELQNKFEKIQRENELNNKRRNEMDPLSEELREKQKQLEELMEKVMDEDMKKMMDDIEKMMEEMNKEKLQKQVDQLKLDNKDLEKELDRSLELFKQLEFEQKLESVIKNLQELKKEERKLAEKSLEKNSDPEQLNKKQEEIEKEFDKIKKDMEDLEKKNNELQDKNKLPDTKPEQQGAKKSMEDAKKQNKEGDKKGANKSQNKAADQMEQMEQKLSQMQSEMQEQQQAEDIEALRRLRQNLLQLSFDQEELIEAVKVTQPNDPRFVELTRTQKRLEDDSKMIEDSLFALSKRNVQIQSMVNKEIASINDNMGKSIKFMADRKVPESLNRQQYVMTSMNNLALMLDESIQQSQKKQSSKKFGKKSCSKPGGGKPSIGEVKKAQKKLSQQLKKLQQQMQEGGKKPGKGGPGGRGSKMSEQAAKLAAEQSAIRNELRRLMEGSQNKPGGKNGGNELSRLQELMEQNEEDLVNMRISRETIRRQEEIMTRLLESEKAEREREFDNKRESKTAEEKFLENQALDEYKRQKDQQIELLETIPLNLKPFYRNKVNEYFNKF